MPATGSRWCNAHGVVVCETMFGSVGLPGVLGFRVPRYVRGRRTRSSAQFTHGNQHCGVLAPAPQRLDEEHIDGTVISLWQNYTTTLPLLSVVRVHCFFSGRGGVFRFSLA